jgi:hypothetical protein
MEMVERRKITWDHEDKTLGRRQWFSFTAV